MEPGGPRTGVEGSAIHKLIVLYLEDRNVRTAAVPSNWDFHLEFVPNVGTLGTTIGRSVEFHRIPVDPLLAIVTLSTESLHRTIHAVEKVMPSSTYHFKTFAFGSTN